jgi:hypothetical protein
MSANGRSEALIPPRGVRRVNRFAHGGTEALIPPRAARKGTQ